ncbi:MAG TPA: Mur ligase domain-containing protein [Candidatus Paceibacterota bacterium]
MHFDSDMLTHIIMQMPAHIYMVGIGGIGMSALAQLLQHQGKDVSGSDREESPTTALLAQKGIRVEIGHPPTVGVRAGDGCTIPADCELLVYSDAVPESNAERQRAKEMGIKEMSYFEAIGAVSKNTRTIAVAGTHGKTTTTGMLAKILQYCGKEPTAIVGSIVRDFGSNFLAGTDDPFIVEACEYRDHLLKLSPQILVITNIELDHTDYFPDLAALQETFKKAVERVPEGGVIVTNPSDPIIAAVLGNSKAPIIDYTTQTVPTLTLIGEFNRHNAMAAKAAARAAFPHLDESFTDKALLEFKGSWRRFEYKGETPTGATVFDDYAHHPTAVSKTIEAAREAYPDKKIVVAFHPHLYSRTKSFLNEFARALALADRSIIAPIYAARETLDPTVSNHILAQKINEVGGHAIALDSFDEIRKALLTINSQLSTDNCLIITMGAGDIYKVAEQIAD